MEIPDDSIDNGVDLSTSVGAVPVDNNSDLSNAA